MAEPVLLTRATKPANDGAWRLGMLTVRADLQDRKLGRILLEAAEAHLDCLARASWSRRERRRV